MSEGAVDTGQTNMGDAAVAGPAPESTGTAQDTTTTSSDWRSELPPDLQNNPSIASTPDVATLAKRVVDLEKVAVGTEKIARPREGWTDEDWNRFYNAIGRPEESSGYKLPEAPEGLPWDGEFQSAMVQKMHAAGLTQKQVEAVIGTYMESVAGQWQEHQTSIAQAEEQGISELRKEWGRAYEGNLDMARRAFKSAAGEGFDDLANLTIEGGGKLGSDPRFIRLFKRIGEGMSEHGLPGGDGKAIARTTLTPDEAQSEMNRLQNPATDEGRAFLSALRDPQNPEHKATVAKWHQLIDQASARR